MFAASDAHVHQLCCQKPGVPILVFSFIACVSSSWHPTSLSPVSHLSEGIITPTFQVEHSGDICGTSVMMKAVGSLFS